MALLLLFGLTVAPRPGVSQVRVVAPAASVLFGARPPTPALRSAPLAEKGDSIRRLIRPTYWKEGALVGGVVGGVGGALWLYPLCGVGCAVASGLLVAIPGAFVGGQFLKPDVESRSSPD